MDPTTAPNARIPLPIKLAFTAFMAVLVPFYWHNYGPTNFLYFCDVALFLTLIGVWTGHRLPLSMACVGILLPQVFWVIDFVANLGGVPLTGMTSYMFDSANPLFNRSLSLFHGWLPFLLLWLVLRVGYDRRAFLAWVGLAWLLIVVCYAWMPAPPPDPAAPNLPVNINYVYGFDDRRAQTWMPELAWVGLWMALQPLVIVGPTHLLLRRICSARGRDE
ncbi:MAG: hypothetical protein KDE27_01480 [Planctomycetes bacterium]|nr:hypothetical protein [Planctomycetota bacterium]